jgi:hypothetical protein
MRLDDASTRSACSRNSIPENGLRDSIQISLCVRSIQRAESESEQLKNLIREDHSDARANACAGSTAAHFNSRRIAQS